MKQLVNYYNINLYGTTKALDEWQKEAMQKPNDMSNYSFLRINDALEYAVRLDRKWSFFNSHNKTLKKILWQLEQANYNGQGLYLFPKKRHKGKMLNAIAWNNENKKLLKSERQFKLIKAIIELDIAGAKLFAKDMLY